MKLDDSLKKRILLDILKKASNNSEHQSYIQLKEYGCKNRDDVECIKNWLITENNIKINSIKGFLLDCVMYEIRLYLRKYGGRVMDGAIAILFILTLALAALAFWAYGQNTPNKTTAMFCPYCKEIKMIPTVSIGYGECSICKRNLKSSGFTGEQWNALSSDEKEKFKKENFYTDKELQSYAEFNAKLQNQVQQMRFNIPQKCPKCQSSNWKHMGTQTKQEFKSAVTIGAYTQINVEEKDTSASYVCGNCGYQITGGARY